ncbi:MAG: hypothetical protein P8P30_03040 [Rickettsiales bacterium]|nr:hypothetical protein [Rickettsiales bacterium]
MWKALKNLMKSKPVDSLDQVVGNLREAFASGDYAGAREMIQNAHMPHLSPRVYGVELTPLPEHFNKALAAYEQLSPNDSSMIEHFEKTFEGEIVQTKFRPMDRAKKEGLTYVSAGTNHSFSALHIDTSYQVIVPAIIKAEAACAQFESNEISQDELTTQLTTIHNDLHGEFSSYTKCREGHTGVMAKREVMGSLRAAISRTEVAVIPKSSDLLNRNHSDLEVIMNSAPDRKITKLEMAAVHVQIMADTLEARKPEAEKAPEVAVSQDMKCAHGKVDNLGEKLSGISGGSQVPSTTSPALQVALTAASQSSGFERK